MNDLSSKANAGDCLREPAPSVTDRDQNVGDAALLQVVEHLEPELSSLGWLDLQTEDVFAAGHIDTQGELYRLFLTVPSSLIFRRSARSRRSIQRVPTAAPAIARLHPALRR